MPKVFEYPVSKTTVLAGAVVVENDTYDDARGTVRCADYFALHGDLVVLADVDGEYVDVTKALEPEHIERLKTKFLDYVNGL